MNVASTIFAPKRLGALAIAGVLLLTACAGNAAKPTEVKITGPASGTEVKVGSSLNIEGSATGDAIARIDVIIDGAVYATIPGPDAGVASFAVPPVPWTPTAAGQHTVVLSAFGIKPEEKLLGRSETVIINAQAAVAPATPTQSAPPTAVPTKAPAAVVAPAAAGTTAPAAAAGSATDAPSVTVTNEFVNVRKGPGIGYDKLGELKQNEKAPVKGRSADNSWYQVAYQSGTGWVIADYVTANAAAKGVPVASAPPPPVQAVVEAPAAAPAANPALIPLVPLAPAAAAPVAAPVVAAPAAPSVGARGILRINVNPVGSGATAYASWNIPNFKEGAFDKGDGRGFVGPIAPSMQVDVPGITGPRTIVVRWSDTSGNQGTDSLTIYVAGQAVAAATAPPSTNCAPGTPDWKGNPNNGNEYQFCARPGGDLEYVGTEYSSVQNFATGTNINVTYKWSLYGIKGLYLMVEPNDSRCGPAGSHGKNLPLNGEGTVSFNIADLSTGGYKVALRVIRNDNVEVRYNEKYLCIGTGGGGSGTSATATPGSSVVNPTAAP